jgi:DNA-binding CsgD family transcriptional regulator
MNMRAKDGFGALTEKEKLTLRLIVRGHDAKSIARSLGLSVHTINERLRDARRKMAVSSSREAARRLLAAEGGDAGSAAPEYSGDTGIGEALGAAPADGGTAPIGGVGRAIRQPRILIGVILMTLVLGLLALTALPHGASVPAPAPVPARVAPDPEVVDAARRFLALVDQGNWDASYRATGPAFRDLNTAEVWAAASEKVRVPLGAVVSRTFVSQEDLPAPPHGYAVVKFRTRFAHKAEAVETVTLDRVAGAWCVVGITIG